MRLSLPTGRRSSAPAVVSSNSPEEWIRVRPFSAFRHRCAFHPALSSLQLFGTKYLYAWRSGENFAEIVHPVMCAFGCTDASVAKLIELIKVRQLDFELQSRAAPVATRQRNQNAA